MDEITVHIEAEVNPTESEEKVRKAIENIFDNMQTCVEPRHIGVKICSESKGLDSLAKFSNLLRRERIRDAARTVLFEGLDKRSISLCLNKQVAYAGHISFANEVAESPLGPIRVKIESPQPRELIAWLTSRTT